MEKKLGFYLPLTNRFWVVFVDSRVFQDLCENKPHMVWRRLKRIMEKEENPGVSPLHYACIFRVNVRIETQ